MDVKFFGGVPQANEPLLVVDMATYGTPIPGTNGWFQVTVPLLPGLFPDLDKYTGFLFATALDSFLLTDVGFTGDDVGGGLVQDVDDNGVVYLYRSGTELKCLELRNLAGINIAEPSVPLLQLYFDQAEALMAMEGWGYVFDTGTDKFVGAEPNLECVQ